MSCPVCHQSNRPNAHFCAKCRAPVLLQDKYRITQLLGRGGYGAVYYAEQLHLGDAPCAVKELLPDPNATPQQEQHAATQFQFEANVLARLSDPALPKVTDSFKEGGRYYLVMEYVEGETLEELLAHRGGPLPEAQVLAWASALCDVLTYLHTRQPNPVIHRDIKPSNIKITPDGKVKLVDFGISKTMALGASTATAARAVSAPYSPMEQYGSGTDARSDIYALGVTLYQLLTNCLPPEAPDRMTHPVMPPRHANSRLSAHVEVMLLKAMEALPSDRYQNTAEMKRALKAPRQPTIPAQLPVSQTAPAYTAPTPTSPSLLPEGCSIPVIVAAVVIALLITSLAACAAYFWTRDTTPPTITRIDPPDKANVPATTGSPITHVIITASYQDDHAVDPKTVRLALDGRDVTSQALISDTGLTYPVDLDPGTHVVLLELRDTVGNKVLRAWQFTVLPQPQAMVTPRLTPTLAPRASEERMIGGAPMVFVPAGDFTMGSNDGNSDEKPVHTVYLDAFSIDKYLTTNALYKKCVEAGKCQPPSPTSSYTRNAYYGNSQYDNYPVIYVSWNDASAFCAWAGKHLPTEAEWEKAARGTDGRVYPWGNTFDKNKANTNESGRGDTTPVDTFLSGASPCGALDMAGNVWEWVADWYDGAYYINSPRNNPKGPSSGQYRIVRGGNWYNGQSDARASSRVYVAPDSRSYVPGFRCAQ